MKCPICKADLTPFDIVHRNEHIELCLENGPSVIDFEDGRQVIRRVLPLDKQRKICPICSKTFQTIHTHFKSCALKNDLNPDLMQDYWFKLNDECKTEKCFPRDLLEDYIEKCTKEGRLGEQVEFAKALLDTLPQDKKRRKKRNCNNSVINLEGGETIVMIDGTNDLNSASSNAGTAIQQLNPTVNQVLMQNAAAYSNRSAKQTNQVQTALATTDTEKKQANIALRIERELAATRHKRYLQALDESNRSDEVQEIHQNTSTILKYTLLS